MRPLLVSATSTLIRTMRSSRHYQLLWQHRPFVVCGNWATATADVRAAPLMSLLQLAAEFHCAGPNVALLTLVRSSFGSDFSQDAQALLLAKEHVWEEAMHSIFG